LIIRAAKCVLAPQSNDIAAFSAMRSLNARITICGRSGDFEVEAT